MKVKTALKIKKNQALLYGSKVEVTMLGTVSEVSKEGATIKLDKVIKTKLKEVRKMMKEKEIAKEILKMYDSDSKGIVDLVADMKDSINDWIVQLAAHIKSVAGKIESEDQFLKVMAELTDELLPLPQPFEFVDNICAHYILKGVDKVLLDKVFGADWFEKLQSGVTKLEASSTKKK